MALGGKGRIEPLESYVSELLVATGVLYALAAANTAVVFVNEGYEYQAVSAPLLLIGLLASTLALIGIASRALERSPTAAKATGAVASLALLAVVLLLVWGIGNRIGPIPDTPAPLAILSLILFISSFAIAGLTVLRSSIFTELVGYLLLAEALALVLVIVLPAVVFEGTVPEEYTIGIEVVQALIILGAGALTRGDTGLGT